MYVHPFETVLYDLSHLMGKKLMIEEVLHGMKWYSKVWTTKVFFYLGITNTIKAHPMASGGYRGLQWFQLQPLLKELEPKISHKR